LKYESILNVTFQEDQSRLRLGHADANFSVVRRTALSPLKNNHALKVSEEQTPRCRLGRVVSRTSAVRAMIYGAIAVAGGKLNFRTQNSHMFLQLAEGVAADT
jgi:hypothetical protein